MQYTDIIDYVHVGRQACDYWHMLWLLSAHKMSFIALHAYTVSRINTYMAIMPKHRGENRQTSTPQIRGEEGGR